MSAVLQQLFMIKSFREAVLTAPLHQNDVVKELQRTFHFMNHSETSFFDPIGLVNACKDIGMKFDIFSQNLF